MNHQSHIRLVFFLVFFLFFSISTVLAGGGTETGERISVDEAREAVESGTAVLVDVRDLGSYVDAHIAGALSFPAGEIAGRAAELEALDKTVITYCACPAEETSLAAASDLVAAGFSDVVVLRGGIRAWADAGLPLNRGPRP